MKERTEIKRRVYLAYGLMVFFAFAIVGQVANIQFVEGEEWRGKAQTQTTRFETIEATRGNIFAEDGSLLATVGPESVVRVWDARTLRLLRSFAKGEPLAGAHAVAPFDFSPDNRRLVVIAGRTELTLYDLQTGQEVGRPVIPGVAPVGCGFSEDGKWIVAAIPRFGFNQATFVARQAVFRDTPAP